MHIRRECQHRGSFRLNGICRGIRLGGRHSELMLMHVRLRFLRVAAVGGMRRLRQQRQYHCEGQQVSQ